MSVWAGIDVGGRRKGFHAVAIDEEGVRAGPGRLETVGDVVGWLEGVRPVLTAVDSPRTPAPDGERSRPCERRFLGAGICQLRATPDRVAIATRDDGYYEWIEHGLELYAALEERGYESVECFPTASWTRWAGKRGTRTRARWTRAALAGLDLTNVPGRTNQDVRDAIAAAVTSRMHCAGRTESFGDLVVPAGRA